MIRIRQDLLAGLSVAGLLIPEAVAYSTIAGLPPAHAIVAAVAGLIIYALAGQSRFAITAPTASSAAILAATVASFAPINPAARIALAGGAILLTGGFFIAASVARLGYLANFISRPVLRGFALGLGITIVIKQLPLVFGIAGVSGSPFHVTKLLVQRAHEFNPISTTLGVASLLLLVGLKRLPSIPGAFIVLVLGIGVSYRFNLSAHSVAVVGSIDFAQLTPGWPDLSRAEWLRLAELALPLFLIIYAESWGSMRTFALRYKESLNANRELLALGAANLVSSVVQGMPVGAGFSATSANEAAGAQSRHAGWIAAAAIVVLMITGGRYIAELPEAILASVVIAALLHALDPRPLLRLFHIKRDEYVGIATAVAVMGLGVLDGMLLAVLLSLAAMVQRRSRPSIVVLGELGESRDYVDIARHSEARVRSGISVVRPQEPMFFANAERILVAISELAEHDPVLRVIVLSLEESSDLDSTAIEALIEFATRQHQAGRIIFLARCKDEVRDVLRKALSNSRPLLSHFYWSVADAVTAAESIR